MNRHSFFLFMSLTFVVATAVAQTRPEATDPSVRRGLEVLLHKPLLPSDFNQRVFDNLWQSWPKKLRDHAADLSPQARRQMAFERYGLTVRPDEGMRGDVSSGETGGRQDEPVKPLQYVVSESGDWTMNCFSCHGGSVYGEPTPGAPSNTYALQTLTEEVRRTKLRLGVQLGRMELGSLVIPLGTTHGTTNAVVFGMGLMHYRDKDLNWTPKPPASFTHHDMDAPPWWHFSKRPNIYIDGFAEKGHRGLMQFTLVPENGREFYLRHEDDFRDVYAYLSSLEPPKFPHSTSTELTDRGRVLFEDHCSKCHGTYAEDDSEADFYPNLMVDIEEIGTDPIRLEALSVEGRAKYASSWFAKNDDGTSQVTIVDPPGYVAPPLDGVWASPPYFHNGSVPTLWHVLHPKERPKIWRRSDVAIDDQRVGFQIEVVERIPYENPDVAKRRTYFDTRRLGKSNVGHDFPDVLTEGEKNAVLEYLKTL